MDVILIIVSGFLSTSLMTMFSYASGRIFRKQFREPELLNSVATHLHILHRPVSKNHPFGWITHYIIGLLFIAVIEWVRYLTGINIYSLYYLVAGALAGLIGVATWFFTFRIDPNPPKINFKMFYAQLLVAHIIFGAGGYASAAFLLGRFAE